MAGLHSSTLSGYNAMEELTCWVSNNVVKTIVTLIVFVSGFIEITPIRINPISAFFGWIGKRINKPVIDDINRVKEKMDGLQEQLIKVRDDADERNAINCRVRILRFGDEIRSGHKHSDESFDQVLSDIDTYEHYCEKHPEFVNNKTVATKRMILKEYEAFINAEIEG